MVRREIAPTSQALQVAFSRLFREPMLSESTSFGSRWGIYEMSSRHFSPSYHWASRGSVSTLVVWKLCAPMPASDVPLIFVVLHQMEAVGIALRLSAFCIQAKNVNAEYVGHIV